MNTPSKVSVFSEACRKLYAPGLSGATFTERSFGFLRGLVSSEFMACGTLDLGTRELELKFDTFQASFGPAMRRLAELMPKYALFRWDPGVNEGRPFCRSQFFSDRQFRDLDLYQDVYRHIDADNHCAVYVPTVPGSVMFFGLERKGRTDFSATEMEMLELGQSQLANAYNLARAFDDIGEEGIRADFLMERGLTAREADVLVWICRGKSNAEIGMLLGVGLYTIKSHVASIFNKAGVCNRLAAVIWAQRICRARRFGATNPACAVTVRTSESCGPGGV